MVVIFSILQAAVLASSLSIDAFTAGFAYGSKKIHIPMMSIQLISLICTAFIGLSMFFGHILLGYLPETLAAVLAFTILFIIGLIKLFDSIVKALIRKQFEKAFKFSAFNIQFILQLYANPEDADSDVSKHLSPNEAVLLAVSLSLDGMAVGFGAALAGINPFALIGWSLLTNVIALLFGRKLGHRLAEKLPFNITWLAGLVLMGLAVSHLL